MIATRQHYNILVGIDAENCVIILEDSFEYADGFHGTTGTILRPVYTAEYDEETSVEGLTEYYQDAWIEQVQARCTDQSLSEWIDEQFFELVSERFDFPYMDPEQLAELSEIVPNPNDVIGYEVVGCGRIFPDALKGIKTRLSGYAQACKLVDRFETTI